MFYCFIHWTLHSEVCMTLIVILIIDDQCINVIISELLSCIIPSVLRKLHEKFSSENQPYYNIYLTFF